MYQLGDQVIYGMHGVCRVADVENKIIDRKLVVYLVLEPVGQEGSRYLVPTHNAAAMGKIHALMSREELMILLLSGFVRENAWISDEGRRKQSYRELITGGDRPLITQMVATLYRHRQELSASGKKFHMCDENFLRDAEKLLSSEIAVILDMPANEAREFLRKTLKEDA